MHATEMNNTRHTHNETARETPCYVPPAIESISIEVECGLAVSVPVGDAGFGDEGHAGGYIDDTLIDDW